ncbi:hypothetical protein Ancab_027627 [Ancistrocladus abbreviatus]
MNFHDSHHGQMFCKCDKGISLIRFSFNLSIWKDISEEISLKKVFDAGFLGRLTISNPREISSFITPLSWRLANALLCIFKNGWLRKGFINVHFKGFSASFSSGYPEESRYFTSISAENFSRPIFSVPPPGIPIFGDDVLGQIQISRSLLQADEDDLAFTDNIVFEDRQIKCQWKMQAQRPIYVPFLGHITEDAEMTHHFNNNKATLLVEEYGDLSLLDDEASESLPDLEDVGEDLENIVGEEGMQNLALDARIRGHQTRVFAQDGSPLGPFYSKVDDGFLRSPVGPHPMVSSVAFFRGTEDWARRLYNGPTPLVYKCRGPAHMTLPDG